MNIRTIGLIKIIFGSLLTFIFAADLIIRLGIAVFGLYLIYSGLKLRNAHTFIHKYFIHFGDRFHSDF